MEITLIGEHSLTIESDTGKTRVTLKGCEGQTEEQQAEAAALVINIIKQKERAEGTSATVKHIPAATSNPIVVLKQPSAPSEVKQTKRTIHTFTKIKKRGPNYVVCFEEYPYEWTPNCKEDGKADREVIAKIVEALGDRVDDNGELNEPLPFWVTMEKTETGKFKGQWDWLTIQEA